ncbi:MAG TPA: bifunctional DNA-formamidopyrimidine glycosylase/DNA-(apurinic or apyrimidinic site) lyase [Acidimicrobiales bacterium]|nr:bifunctional DNA-formamidopyrimidine glycosylase/DNA-(apurinic or apyrimidinic site) lyase [Acidimicrobiales bacterium]
MPELPEVETVRRDLEKEVAGKRIRAVEVTGTRTVRRHKSKKEFIGRLEGRAIIAAERKGKYLLLRLGPPGGGTKLPAGAPVEHLVVHLGMSGQLLLVRNAKTALDKHTHVVISLVGAGQLRFVDPRTFGEMFVATADELEAQVPELAHLGFDPIDDIISWTHFAELLYARKRKLKDLLMDQTFLAGIGNIYSDEILWSAGLRYDRSSASLSSQEVRRLYRAMVETLQEAIKHRGSSLADQQYRDLFGEVGDYASQHNVYDREGQPCRRCRTPITRIKVSGRSHFLCERCQV